MNSKENNTKKRSVFSILAAVLLTALVGTGGTYAYFTYADYNANKLNVGYNEISILEDFEAPEELKQGENVYKKEIKIKNTGNVDTYVRVFLDFSTGTSRDASFFSSDGTTFTKVDEYTVKNWDYVDEIEDASLSGYYYYLLPLAPGEETTVLLDSVKTVFANAADVEEYEIIVYAESIQTHDYDGNEINDAKAAWKKFMEE